MSNDLPAPWIDWIAENQALGVSQSDIFDVLVANGFDASLAHEQAGRAAHPSPSPMKIENGDVLVES